MTSSEPKLSAVAPALARYERDLLMDVVWRRPGLSPRDRSIVTVSALIARGQLALMPSQVGLALDHGVEAGEISEILAHLAFYSGWGQAVAAVPALERVFAERGIGPEQLPPASPQLTAIDPAAEERRAASVQQNVGPVSANLVEDTGAVLFRDLWLRPGLAPRDRSLVTVAALIAGGQVAQITFHLGRAMDNGLTRGEASEIVSHLAYYAGWPNAMSAVPVFMSVFESRQA